MCSVDDVISSFQTDVDLVADGHVDDRSSRDPTADRHVAAGPRRLGRGAGLAQDGVRRAGARRRAAVGRRRRADVGRTALAGDGEVVQREADGLARSNDHGPRRQNRPTPGQLRHEARQEAGPRRTDRGRSRVDTEITSRLNCSSANENIELLGQKRRMGPVT